MTLSSRHPARDPPLSKSWPTRRARAETRTLDRPRRSQPIAPPRRTTWPLQPPSSDWQTMTAPSVTSQAIAVVLLPHVPGTTSSRPRRVDPRGVRATSRSSLTITTSHLSLSTLKCPILRFSQLSAHPSHRTAVHGACQTPRGYLACPCRTLFARARQTIAQEVWHRRRQSHLVTFRSTTSATLRLDRHLCMDASPVRLLVTSLSAFQVANDEAQDPCLNRASHVQSDTSLASRFLCPKGWRPCPTFRPRIHPSRLRRPQVLPHPHQPSPCLKM